MFARPDTGRHRLSEFCNGDGGGHAAPGPWATAHAPALLETPDGSLLCAWFAGSFEGSGDVSIVCARLPKGAARWEAPVQVSHDEKRSEQNPSLFLAPDGAVWAVYTAQLTVCPARIIYSSRLSSAGRKVRTAAVPGGERMCCLPGRKLLPPAHPGACRVGAGYSQTGCAATAHPVWPETRRRFRSPTIRAVRRTVEMPGSNGRVHANVVELAPGRLAAFMRSRAANFIYRSESLDDGNTWSEPVPTVLPLTTPASAPSSCKVDALPLPITPPIRLRRSRYSLARPSLPGCGGPQRGRRPMADDSSYGAGRGVLWGQKNSTNNRQYSTRI